MTDCLHMQYYKTVMPARMLPSSINMQQPSLLDTSLLTHNRLLRFEKGAVSCKKGPEHTQSTWDTEIPARWYLFWRMAYLSRTLASISPPLPFDSASHHHPKSLTAASHVKKLNQPKLAFTSQNLSGQKTTRTRTRMESLKRFCPSAVQTGRMTCSQTRHHQLASPLTKRHLGSRLSFSSFFDLHTRGTVFLQHSYSQKSHCT
jgi:hypothetical protein